VATPLTLEDLGRLPAETVAFELLPSLPSAATFRRDNEIARLIGEMTPAPKGPGVHRMYPFEEHPDAAVALAAALDRLIHHGLLVAWPPADPRYENSGRGEMRSWTRLGVDLRRRSNARDVVRARGRLGVDLHPILERELRDLVAVGAFEEATFAALRAVESRVRALAGEPRSIKGQRLIGVALMQTAFKPGGGALADPEAEPGERQGVMELFAGAFGAVRNPLGHTMVRWDDPTEAAEFVLFADLLMRQLDRVESRLNNDVRAEH
jgi:uncharacterized protein (TIGR02391 family)